MLGINPISQFRKLRLSIAKGPIQGHIHGRAGTYNRLFCSFRDTHDCMAPMLFRPSLFSFPNANCPEQSDHLLCTHCVPGSTQQLMYSTSSKPHNSSTPSTLHVRKQRLTEIKLLAHNHRLLGSKARFQMKAFLQENFKHQIRDGCDHL